MVEDSANVSIDTRSAIAAEAVLLWCAVLLTKYEGDSSAKKTGVKTYLGDLMLGTGLDTAWKIALLYGILLVISEIGNATWPAYLGLMIVASGIVYEVGAATQAFQRLLGE